MNYYLLVTVILWGLNYPLSKGAFSTIDPIAFTAWRFLLAIPFLWLYSLKQPKIKLEQTDVIPMVLTGLFGIGIYQAFYTFSLFYTSSTNTALLVSSSPIFTVVILLFLGKLKIRLREFIGVLLGMIGVLIIVLNRAQLSPGSIPILGNSLGLTAAFIWGYHALLSRFWTTKYSPLIFTHYSFIIAALLFWLLVLILKAPFWPIAPAALPGLIFSSLGAGVIAHICWFEGINGLGSKKAMYYMYLVPVLAALFGNWLLGETLNLFQLAGGVVVFTGLYLSQQTDAG